MENVLASHQRCAHDKEMKYKQMCFGAMLLKDCL